MKEELKTYLLNLQGLEFIYEKNLFPELEYIFKHALTQEVAYNSLLQKRRKEIHEKIGSAIEQIYAERLEEFYEILSYHYSKGENSDKAYQYLMLSGNKAVKNFSNNEAFRFYNESIAVVAQMTETEENKRKQIEVRQLIAPILDCLGFPEGSFQILQRGSGIAEEIGDERSLAIFYSWLGNYYSSKGNPLLGIQYSEKSFQQTEKTEDVDLMAPVGFVLSISYLISGAFFKVFDVASKVIKVLEKTKKESEFFGRTVNAYVHMHGTCGIALAQLGRFDEGEDFCEKGLRFAHSINHLPSLGWAELSYGSLYSTRGDGRSTIEHSERSLKHLEEGNVNHLLPMAFLSLGAGYGLLGEIETARNHLQKGLKMLKDLGLSFTKSSFYSLMSLVHFESGEYESAQSCAEKALNLAQENKEKHYEGRSWIFLGRILGKKEPAQMDKAEDYIQRGFKISDELKLMPYVSSCYYYLGELYADKGRNKMALENLKKAEGMFKEMGMDYYLAKTQEMLKRV